MTPTLQTYYQEKVVPALQEKLGLKNVNQVPKLEKIVVSSHVGYAMAERKTATEDAVEEIARITGQKPSVIFARKTSPSPKTRRLSRANSSTGARCPRRVFVKKTSIS